MLEFFTTNAPDPHHWTLNSCFGAFLSVWVHLELFRYCTKLAAKRAKLVQLMQKFVPRSRVIIFRNERSRSTPLDTKLMFWSGFSIWVHLEPFCYYTKLAAKHAKLVQLIQKFVPRCLVRISHNKLSWSTPLEPKIMFWRISFCLGAFVTVSLLHKTWCKTRQTGAINVKVHATKSCHNFS